MTGMKPFEAAARDLIEGLGEFDDEQVVLSLLMLAIQWQWSTQALAGHLVGRMNQDTLRDLLRRYRRYMEQLVPEWLR